MLRLLKICLWAGCVLVGIQSARAFSLGGPIGNAADDWQVPVIGYKIGGDIVAPKNIGEEYRWNLPVVYYAYDQNFLDYFGSNGVVEVDKAFAILNNAFTNNPNGVNVGLDGYSSDLSELPLTSEQINYTAQGLGLIDLKSLTLGLMAEGLGLAEPERFAWTLRARDHIANTPACPDGMNYLVVQRNFDPVTYVNSPYVNGTLYTYLISEACTGGNPLAVAEPQPVAMPADTFTAVASQRLLLGGYYTTLTRDDVGGLRYMLRTNNLNVESPGLGEAFFSRTTNFSQTIVTTLDLTTFLDLIPHTDPTTLLALPQYQGLIISSVQTNFYITNSTVTFLFFTNYPWMPAGTIALVFGSQSSLYFATNYVYTFANIVTNHFYTNWPTIFQTNTISVSPFSVPPNYVLQTNKLNSTTRRGPGGDFYILPDGIAGYVFVPGLVITNKGSTNVVDPNLISVNANSVRQKQTTYFFTNYQYAAYAILLTPIQNSATNLLYQGIEKITFVRRDYDSLLSQTWIATTNNYTLNTVSGNVVVANLVRRVVTAPDILFTAKDIPPADLNGFLSPFTASRDINFDQTHILNNLAGPGTIGPQKVITYNTEAPVFYNFSGFQGETTLPDLVYGSFDGTTNTPIVYPDGTSIMNLENQVLMQITTANLPDGTNNVIYAGGGVQLTGSGGSPPYTWDIVGNALPPGLGLSSDGLISGTPTSVATFDFTVRMTDVGARSVEGSFSITIHP